MNQENNVFSALPLHADILRALSRANFVTPTPIQHQAIPPILENSDVIGVAQTGTGKTLAFGLPLIHRILSRVEGKGLIVVPTRELALQVKESLQKIGSPFGIKISVLIGGASMHLQLQSLKKGPDIVIATPGRLNDHLEQKSIRLHSVKYFVLDEADRMLDMGFWPQVKKIIAELPKERQTLLFSATLSREIMDLATHHMKSPTSIEVAPSGTTAENVTQEFFIVHRENKIHLLEKVLQKYEGPTIIFTRTKHGTEKLKRAVVAMGHRASDLHGNRSLGQRREALQGFKDGKFRVLVATDIASRGIDVQGVELVVNYDLPMHSEDYVHRIGRTGRAGKEGHAISFAMPEERRDMKDIERLTRQSLTVSPLPEFPPGVLKPIRSIEDRPRRSFGGGFSRKPYGNRSRGGRSFSPQRGAFKRR